MMTITEHGWQGWRGHIIALFAGAIVPLSFAPFHYYPVAVIGLTLLFLSWQGVSAKQAAIRGFIFGLGMFGVGVSWVYVAIHDFGNASILLSTLLTSLFVSLIASCLAAVAWLTKKNTSSVLSSIDFVLILPVSWLVFELFKGWFLTGFPWLEIGVGQIDGPLRGYIPVIGALGASLLVALSAGLLAASWQSKRWQLILPVLLIWAGGYALSLKSWTEPTYNTIKVSLIQGNIPQQTKWDREQVFKTLALYQELTEQNWDSDLVVWPENAVTAFYHQVKGFYLDPLAEQARANQTDILLGLPVMEQSSGRYFNSMMSLGAQEGFYHKSHLVPFGDYMPFEWLRGLIDFFELPMSSFKPGSIAPELLQVAGQKVGISICYEDVFSTEILRSVPEAGLLVNATNNAWYGDSFAPHQHLQISQNRALETGRPILRVTTNGISALIDYQGNLQAKTPQFEQAVLTGNVQPRWGSTPYVSWGQWPLWLLSLFMMIVWAYYRRIDAIKQAD